MPQIYKGKNMRSESNLTILWLLSTALITVAEVVRIKEPHWFSLENKKAGANIIKV